MTRLDLPALQEVVEALARRIEVPADHLPTYGFSEQSGRPHIEVSQVYHFVVAERGRENRRDITTELDLLLYWVFEAATSQMASNHELRNRKPGEDFRRQRFARHVEFLECISRAWASKLRAKHNDILILHPFQDE